MVQGPSVAALEALRDTSASIDQQIDILRQLKNDIVGHQQRKELVVKQAVVEPIVRIASLPNGRGSFSQVVREEDGWSSEDEARLQATLTLGSLASGGAAFLQPLAAAGAPECLLSNLETRQPPKIVLATLRAMRGLAEQSAANIRADDPLRVDIIDERSLNMLQACLLENAPPTHRRQLFHLAADIIIAAAAEEETRDKILHSAVWPALIGNFVHGASEFHPYLRNNPKSAPSRDNFIKVVSAISTVIEGSTYRTANFIHHHITHTLLPQTLQQPSMALLPPLHIPPLKQVSFNGGSASFPALSSMQSHGANRSLGLSHSSGQMFDTEYVHTFCLYLVHLVKAMPESSTLPALRILAAVNIAIDAHQSLASQTMDIQQKQRERERYIAVCAVPVAIRLIQTACEKNGVEEMSLAEQEERRELKPEACNVLASLIRSSKELQVAAVEGGAIKRVCPILKKSFDNVTSTKPMWSARAKNPDEITAPPTCKLGSKGMPPEMDYAMRCRRGALNAIAALANKEDVHRQAIVQAGVVQCIIDSLKPFAADAPEKMAKNSGQVSPKDGNTTAVIIAACHAAQAMSRSVSLLRTSLIDAGIAKPIFELLKHPVLDVRVAATEVCCNLVLEFSPMREDLLNAGVIKTLTEHARQSEMGLRLSSLWALKHLVLAASREIKVQTLEELGVGWLVAAVQGQVRSDTSDGGGEVVINASGGLSAPNAAGERVDLLNPSSMDVDDPPAFSADYDDDGDGEVLYDEVSSTHYRASNMRSTLNQPSSAREQSTQNSKKYLQRLRELEHDPNRRSRGHDIAVQEQGLDFIRNLLNGDDCAYMLDHLLSQVGTTQVFSMLTDKLAPLNPQQAGTTTTSTRQSSVSSSSSTAQLRPVYSPTPLILSTIHVLTHIANGSPSQKQLLIAQKPLLAAWLPHFHHPDRRVRTISVWAVNSLTWIEDENDRPAAQMRARELRGVGISAAVEALKGDGDLDVRERVRVAVRQMEALG